MAFRVRTVAGFLLGPVAATISFVGFGIAAGSLDDRLILPELLYSLFGNYVGFLLIFVPFLWHFRIRFQSGVIRLWAICIMSTLSVTIIPVLFTILQISTTDNMSINYKAIILNGKLTLHGAIYYAQELLLIGLTGCVAGVVFWYVARSKNAAQRQGLSS